MVGGTLFLAGLGGERLWSITLGGDAPALNRTVVSDSLGGTLGRIRDVAPTADGGLLLLTNNTDGRGSAQTGDDRLARVALEPGAS
jgi:glucose/arabinose dehydrogenase